MRACIVQARMGSTRLPGKVLAELGGKPMLVRQLERLSRCRMLDRIVVATTTLPADDVIQAVVVAAGFPVLRGPVDDVLERYRWAARVLHAEVVVRVTGDCPLIDPVVVDRVVTAVEDRSTPCDYASNTLRRTWPRGLDVEAFHADVLERAARLGQTPASREHVTWLVHRERPELFRLRPVLQDNARDDSDLRWTVDVPEDLSVVRAIWRGMRLSDLPATNYEQIVAWARSNSVVSSGNANVEQRHA